MTARGEMAALLARRYRGCRCSPQTIDAIARLATDPETAPVVFRWLVEAGVLARGDEACDCTTTMPVWPSDPPWDKPWDGHYHVVLGTR